MVTQKGFSQIVLIIGLIVFVGGISLGGYFLNSSGKKSEQKNETHNISKQESSPSPSPSPSESVSQITPVDTKNVGKDTASYSCNKDKDVCFENGNLNLTIQEGYMEDSDSWVADQVKLIGQGQGGFELKLEGFPKEFSARSQNQDFPAGTSTKVYLRAQKDVAKKGSFSGKISVRSFITNITTTANLTINYIDPDKEKAHSIPASVNIDCKIKFSDDHKDGYLDCGSYEQYYQLKFYYFGNHKKIELRSTPDPESIRSLKIRFFNNSTTGEVNNLATVYIDPVGLPNKYHEEPSREYKGYFAFIDQETQKEVLRVPYNYKISR